jgi:hypothetical protein
MLKLFFQSGDLFQSHSQFLFAGYALFFHHPGLFFEGIVNQLQLIERMRLISDLIFNCKINFSLPLNMSRPPELAFFDFSFQLLVPFGECLVVSG